MEKKTIGNFIAALRKANGMTQQQLADRLNVSNKTVSRWERDESLPDIILIPVIAEIFEVTSDELLKGTRNSNLVEKEKPSQKTDKQVKRILDSNITKFKSISYISFTLVIVGMIVMLVSGYGFYKVVLGFGLGVTFFVSSILLQVIITTFALSAVNSEEFDGNMLYIYRRLVIKYLLAVIYSNVVAFVSCIPFIVMRSGYYVDSILNFSSWLSVLPICFFVAFVINIIISIISSKIIINKQALLIGEEYLSNLIRLTKMKMKYFFIILAIMIVTFYIQLIVNSSNFTKGQTFDTFEDFKEFVETPVSPEYEYGNQVTKDSMVESITVEHEEELPQSTMNYNGNEYKYYFRNHSIAVISSGSSKPITVYTKSDIRQGNKVKEIINNAFVILYFIEVIFGSGLYFRKRKYLLPSDR